MTWRFSPEVVNAFHDIGIPVPAGLSSFIQKVLSMSVIKEGEVELTSMGLGLRILKRRYEILVDLLEHTPEKTH